MFFFCLSSSNPWQECGSLGENIGSIGGPFGRPPSFGKDFLQGSLSTCWPCCPRQSNIARWSGTSKAFFWFCHWTDCQQGVVPTTPHMVFSPCVCPGVCYIRNRERWIQQVSQKHVHSGQIRPGGQRQLCVFPQCKAHNPWVCGEARYPGVGHHTRDDTWRRLWKLGCKEYKTSRPMLVRLCITCRDEAAMRERIWLAHWFKWQTIQNRQDFISHKVHLRHGLPLCINRWYQHIDSWHLWLHLHVTWRKGSIQWDETSGCHLWGASPWRSDETTNQKVMATCWVFFSACVCHGNVRSFSGCWSRYWNLPCKQNRKPLGGLPFCEGAMLLQQEYPEIHAFIGFSGLWLHWPEFEAHPTGRGCHWVMCLVYFVCHTALLGTGNTQCYLRHVCNIQLHPLY